MPIKSDKLFAKNGILFTLYADPEHSFFLSRTITSVVVFASINMLFYLI